MHPKFIRAFHPAASNDDDTTGIPLLPSNSNDAMCEDDVIADARAYDTMRDELYHSWSVSGKQGQNPDELPRGQVCNAYARMIDEQRAKAGTRAQER